MGKRRWGSVTRHGDRFRARAGDEHRTSLGLFDTEDAADAALDEAHRFHRAQLRATGKDAALVAYGRALLDRWEKNGTRRAIGRDRRRFEAHIATAPFAEFPIAAIEHRTVQRWVRVLAAGEAGGPRGDGRRRNRRTVLNILNLLRTILRMAIEDELIDDSPARGILVPRTPTIEEDFLYLEPPEVDRIIAATPGQPVSSKRLSAIIVATFAGLRAGELWGLRWGDVVLSGRPELVVRYSRDEATKGGRVRRVPLLEPARAALEAWRTEQRGRRVACRADELVWPNRDGGIYGDGYDAGWANRRQNRNGRRWTSLGARWHLGIIRRVPFKDLRHTCACHLLRGTWVARGWIARPLSLVEIRDWLGHRSITTTEKYYARLAPGGLLDVLPAPVGTTP